MSSSIIMYSSVAWIILCFCIVNVSTSRSSCVGQRCNFRNDLSAEILQPVDVSLLKCCACGKATYRMTFTGMWSSQTHPHHFPGPMSSWSTLIGCSHSNGYEMWRHGGLASAGVKMVSEMGSTRKIEEDMRQQGRNVFNVIKVPGLWWGVGQSVTEFRADRKRNLLSVISRIIPSPDWYVGIDRLNLCHVNCTWKEEETIELFPLDAGTDDGINFISVNSKSVPQQPIRRITTRLHDHPKSSFYLPDNDVIRPFAQIKLELIAASGSCFIDGGKPPAPQKPARIDCKVSRWSSWTPCSVTCGEGQQIRGRVVMVTPMHDGIDCPPLYEYKKCYKKQCEDPNDCKVSSWSKWSKCSGTCGVGRKKRSRTILRKPTSKRRCPALIKKRRCRLPPCQGDKKTDKIVDCEVSPWSRWSKCNKLCRGKKKRTRYVLKRPRNGGRPCPQTREKRKCNRRKCPKK